MKNLFLSLLTLFFSYSTFATVDAITEVHLVVQDVQDPDRFTIQRAPVVGCYGLAQGPQLQQFTSEYKVPVNVGCGSFPLLTENINYLVCAKVVQASESKDFTTFSDITLDISKCEAKNNSHFITMVKTAAKRNFPQKKGEVRLKLIK